ncbi:MAG: polysaccharide deacetylase [Betaproteobacteria bacterium]|nr:polysaccharide deacetylase [Betaproteobacteria bacterium]
MSKRHIVCLTFDFDAISGFIARGQTSASWISRGEFGPRVAAPRLLGLLGKYGIRSTWFVPGHTIETFPGACEQVHAAGHEIAHHGWTHRSPASLTREQEEAELVRGNNAIKGLTGRTARGYRSPSWDLSRHSVELMLKHRVVYDSSMMGDDYTPYYARQGDAIELEQPARFGQATRLVEMPIHWSTDDSPHFEFVRTETTIRQGLMNASAVLENWVNDFLYMKDAVQWGVLTYTCHPFVIGRGHRMLMLERLIRTVAEHGAVFLTMEQAAEEFRQRSAPKP